jgi:hypothetical protein
MTNSAEIIERERRFLLPTYNRYPIVLARGKGVFLFDSEGNRYLDFVAGLGVNALGHAHPRVLKAIREQSSRAIHFSNLLPPVSGTARRKTLPAFGSEPGFFLEFRYRGHRGLDQTRPPRRTPGRWRSQKPARRSAGFVSRTNFWLDVPHRPGQIPQGVRASARSS